MEAKRIPFDPSRWMASLRDALGQWETSNILRICADFDAVVTFVEGGWPEVESLRDSIRQLRRTELEYDPNPSLILLDAQSFLLRCSQSFDNGEALAQLIDQGVRVESRLRRAIAEAGGVAPAVASLERGPPSTTPTGGRATVPIKPGPARWSVSFQSPTGWTLLILSVIVVIGAYDRLHALGSTSIFTDEGQSTLIAISILNHGYPVITAPHLINNWEPLYPYFEAMSIGILGSTNLAFRLPSALIGIALIPIAYILGARLRDRFVGIALAAMVALSSEYIAWSRQARWYMLLATILALGCLAALEWTRSPDPRRRQICLVGMMAFFVLAGLTSIGLFLLYLPGVLAGVVVYLAVQHWEVVKRFFGRPSPPVTLPQLPRAKLVPYRFRLWVLIAVLAGAGLVLGFEAQRISDAFTAVLARVFGFSPYPLVWSNNFSIFLGQYYPGVVAMSVLSVYFIALRRSAFELALLGFSGASFLSVSVGASLSNDIFSGALSFERHIVPLLFFLFFLSAISLVELIGRTYRWLSSGVRNIPPMTNVKPVLFGIVVVVVLVLPGILIPSTYVVYVRAQASPANNLVQWYPFSLNPAFPSALYHEEQANFHLSCQYIQAHRVAADVVAADLPAAPQVYLGSVQYWVYAVPRPTAIWYIQGQPTFFMTGSILVSNTSQLEGLMMNSSGWLITAVPFTSLSRGQSLVVSDFLVQESAGSDVSITLYHWNRTTPVGLLRTIESEFAGLKKIGNNLSLLTDWAGTAGVTSFPDRLVLLPLEGYIIQHVSAGVAPLAVLYYVYNNRPDLQLQFPELLVPPYNHTGLVHWASLVTSGALNDTAQAILAPYASWYSAHG